MFPNNDACLHHIFRSNYPYLEGYHRIKKRLAYVNNVGHQIYPLKGTIFEKSRTSLTKWFFAIYIFHLSKNGVSAKEMERYLGVTYKTAWRMGMRIRTLMDQDKDKLRGIIEADETYIGGRRRTSNKFKDRAVTLGIVQRGGQVRVKVIERRDEFNVIPYLDQNIKKRSTLYTDEAKVYTVAFNFKRETVTHSKHQYVNGEVHTNTIEGFWGQLKRSLHGTYHCVSNEHLQLYIDEFAFRYNYRGLVFDEMMKRL